MDASATENIILVIVLAVVWFIFVKPIYQPGSGKEWIAIWFRTSMAISAMYGAAWLMSSVSSQFFELNHEVMGIEALTLVAVIVLSLIFFVWMWQYVITEEKSVLNSAFEITVSFIVADMAVIEAMGELGGAAFKFVVFVISIVIISKLLNRAKERWTNHLDHEVKRTWRLVAGCMVISPFAASTLAYYFLGNSLPEALWWPLSIMNNATYWFEEVI